MADAPRHFLLTSSANSDACVLDRFPSVRDYLWQATEGVRVGKASPDRLELPMSQRMGGKGVGDIVRNTLGFLVLSERAASVLKSASTAEVEYLPLTIIDHKDRRVSAPFFIANVLGTLDCVDRRASAFEESALKKGEFFSITSLVLDPQRLDPARNIFRVPEMPRLILVTSDVATALQKSDLTGIELVDPVGPLEI